MHKPVELCAANIASDDLILINQQVCPHVIPAAWVIRNTVADAFAAFALVLFQVEPLAALDFIIVFIDLIEFLRDEHLVYFYRLALGLPAKLL